MCTASTMPGPSDLKPILADPWSNHTLLEHLFDQLETGSVLLPECQWWAAKQ